MNKEVQIHFEFFPKAWDTGVSAQMFKCLIGPDRLFPASRWGYEGEQRLPHKMSDVHAKLAHHYEAMSTGRPLQLFADKGQPAFWFNLVRVEWNEKSSFGSTLFWPKKLSILVPLDHWRAQDWMPDLIAVAKMTQAPLMSLDYAHPKDHQSTFYETRDQMTRIVQGTVHAKASMGPWRGLGRIGFRRVFGPDIVAMFGAARLSALGANVATDHGDGYWSVSTAADPEDWLGQAAQTREAMIISDLGADHFADTQNNRLASVVPNFPAHLIPDDAKLFERYGARLKPL